tara:strand:- start:41150 stop:41842 length:693 start_codon:yes stop_codon:yes gene_type:complete
MNLEEITACLDPYAQQERTFLLRITKILKACQDSKNLMIGVYLVEENHFLYCNNCLKTIVGEKFTNMLKYGWDFWFSIITPIESILVKDTITDFFAASYLQDPLTLRYHITDHLDRRIYIKHEILLHKIAKYTLAINYFFDVTDKERLELCFDLSQDGFKSQSSSGNMHISAREKEVLHLIADGYSSKEIANMLFISNHTAISHRKNLIEKFQVKNTAHLIKKAAEFSCL